jgi:Fur family transcriptional regulator, ferric uptake regulator
MSIVPESARNFRNNRYHITRQRQAVLKAITGTNDYYTPAEVHRKVRRQTPGIGQSTVYRTLNLLVKLDMACMIDGYGKSRRYGVCPRTPHIHLICTDCGRVKSITGPCVAQLEQGLALETGFTTGGHRVCITGYCENCRDAAARRQTE